MTSKPPPLPPSSRMANNVLPSGSTNEDSRRNIPPELSNDSTLEGEQNWLIYSLAAFLLLLAILLLILSVRVKLQRSGPVSIDSSGNSGVVQEANISSTSGSRNADVNSLPESDRASSQHSPLEMQSQQNADSGSSKAVKETEVLSEKEADVNSNSSETSESEETLHPSLTAEAQELPIIPKFNANRGHHSGSLASDDGLNPFFTSLEAESIVFVIDRSGSMSGDHRLARVIVALNETIDRLKPEQEFLLVFFSDSYELHPSLKQLVSATDINKQLIKKWASGIAVGGGTMPVDAMLYAIEQNPGRIVLLSDGEFNPLDVALITQFNRKRTKPIRIDGIGLDESVQTLQELAKSNQGIYYSAK